MFLPTCQGRGGGWEQAVGGAGWGGDSQRAGGAFTEFRFCVQSADAAELRNR